MLLTAFRRLGWFRVLLAAELAFGLMAAGGLWLLRDQALEGEARMLDALARALALQADRTLGIGQVMLQTTGEELTRGLVAPTGPETDRLLRERVRALPAFRALSLFDAEGRRIATSRDEAAPAPHGVGERDFFQAARQAPTPQIYLSQPYVALGDGRPAVSLSIGWRDGQGRFGGVLSLVADPDFLDGSVSSIAGDEDIGHAILRRDGTGATIGTDPPTPGRALPQALRVALAQEQGPGPPGQDLAATVLEHEGRAVLAAMVPLKALPLVQVVWRDTSAVLAGWKDMVGLAVAFTGAMVAVTVAFGLRLARDQLRVDALEQSLARSRKFEALGQLSGGVAHDFNNVLAAVVGFGELARLEAADGGKQARHLDQVLQAAERGRQQVERILAFSRGQPRRSVSFGLQAVVQEVLDHLAASKRAVVSVEADLQAPERAVRGDPTSTYEAVMNLCTNALQAMPEGGTLGVRLDELHLSAPRQTYDSTLAAGHYLRLQVRDSGTGMTAEVLAHLFEPFFTTKGRHGGTGIGLAVVHGVVADMGGGIDVESAPGRGTCFTLLMPVSPEPPQPQDAAGGEVPQGQGQTVLVVDDEPALVELAEELLAGLGYEPLGTVSSVRALETLREDPSRFDLLLTDEVMPEMSGTALARAARELRPDLPIVLASGYGGGQFESRAAEAGVRIVLTKPLSRRTLAQALHRALQGTVQG